MFWYAPEEFKDDQIQMAAYAVFVQSAPLTIESYKEALQQKIAMELERCQCDSTEIYELLCSAFELESWFSADQIAIQVADTMTLRLSSEPVLLIEINDVEVIGMAQSQTQNPDVLLYQAVSDI